MLREAEKKRKAEQRKSTSDYPSSKSKSIPNLADLRDPIEPAVPTTRPRSKSVSQAPNTDRHIRRNNSLSSANMKRVNSSRKLSYSIIE